MLVERHGVKIRIHDARLFWLERTRSAATGSETGLQQSLVIEATDRESHEPIHIFVFNANNNIEHEWQLRATALFAVRNRMESFFLCLSQPAMLLRSSFTADTMTKTFL